MLFRKANFTDVEAIYELLSNYAEQGLMLARSRNMLYESLRDFIVAEEEGELVAAGALHLMWDQLAEVRALAVKPYATKTGVGRKIVEHLEEDGKALGIKTVFALTYQPGFFAKLGYRELTKEELPHKLWKECINCPKFPKCDEIAMKKDLSE